MLTLLLGSLFFAPQSSLQPLFAEANGTVDCVFADAYPTSGINELIGLGDFDADGLPDLLWSGVHWNRGEGRFERVATSGPPTLTAAFFAETFDLEGDGDVDLMIGPDLRLYANRGDGTFELRLRHIPSLGIDDSVSAAVHADFNGDGIQDIYYWSRGVDFTGLTQVCSDVFLSPSFQRTPSLAPTFEVVELLALDVDGDGDVDILGSEGIAGLVPSGLFVLNNPGNGAFTLSSGSPPGFPAATIELKAVADFDGDGDEDVIAGDDFAVSLLLNDGNGAFVPGPNLSAVSTPTASLTVHDLDDDGVMDLISGQGLEVAGLLNDGSGNFTTSFVTAMGVGNRPVYYVDLDNDGDKDILAQEGPDRSPNVLQQVAPGQFKRVAESLAGELRWRHYALGDVDGDGDPDALFEDSFEVGIHLNDGTGTFVLDASRLPSLSLPQAARCFLDFDQDGDLDLFAGGQTSALLVNDGAGFFQLASVSLPSLPVDPRFAEGQDLNGDGLPELALIVGPTAEVRIWENLGAAGFLDRPVPATCTVASTARWLDFGDTNGDGSLDVLAGDSIWENAPWAASGPLPFQAAPTPLGFAAQCLGDVDGDGDLDAVGGDVAFLNDGTGTFLPTAAGTPNLLCLDLADLDEDGDLDVLSERSRSILAWYRNDGAGNFSIGGVDNGSLFGVRPLSSCTIRHSAINFDQPVPRLADADYDGDPDLFWGSNGLGSTYIYANRMRGLYVKGVPGFGRDLLLSIYGDPGQRYFVGFAQSLVPTQLPQGTLLLDVATLFVPSTGAIDNSGLTELAFPIPNDPALANAHFLTQGAVGTPLRLTNADWFAFDDR